jgi:hypothetical protein
MVGTVTLPSVREALGDVTVGGDANVTAGELLTLQVLWHVADRVSQFIVQPA